MAAIITTGQTDADFPDLPSVDTFVSPLQAITSQLQEANGYLAKLDDSFSYVIDLLEANRLDDLENQRERKDSSKKIGTPLGKAKEEDDGNGLGLIAALLAGGLIAGLIGAIPGAIAGFVVGLTEWSLAFFRGVGAWVKTKWERLTKPIITKFDEIGKSISAKLDGIKNSTFFTKLQGIGSRLNTLFIKPFEDVFKMFKGTGAAPKPGFFDNIGKAFGKFFGFFRVLGRVFVPLTVLIDGISRSFEEFGKLSDDASISEKIGAAVKVVTKTFFGLFTGLGDLAKSFVSWIIEKIAGEDNPVSNFLDSFSFTDIMEKIVDLVVNGWNMLLNADWGKMFDDGIEIIQDGMKKLWEKTKDLFSSIADTLTDAVKSFVSAILPSKDAFRFEIPALVVAGREVVSATEFDLNPIPSALYEWAGEGSKQKISPSSSGTNASSVAQQRTSEIQVSAMDSLGNQVPVTVNVVNNNQRTSNSSTNVQQQFPASFNGIPQSYSNTRASSTNFNSR